MSLILDIGIIALLLLFFFLGMKRGAVKTLIHILGTLASITVSIWLGQYIAQWVYDVFFKQSLIQNMSQQLMETGGTQAQAGLASALGVLPDFLVKLFPNFGIDTAALGGSIQNTADVAAQSIEKVIAPVMIALISLVVMVVLFFVLSILVRLVGSAVGRIFELPVLRGVNSFFGAILGIVQGVLIVALLVFLIKLLVPTLSDFPQLFNAQTIGNTFVFKYFYNILPFGGALSAADVSSVSSLAPTAPTGGTQTG